MSAITTRGVCLWPGHIDLQLFVHLVLGIVTWSSYNLSAWGYHPPRAREDKRAHHRALPSHPGAERVYKGRNTDGSSVSVVKSSTTELQHCCRNVQVEWLDCSRIYRLIRGIVHQTEHLQCKAEMELLSMRRDTARIPSLSQSWDTTNNWTKLSLGPIGSLQIIGPSYPWDQ